MTYKTAQIAKLIGVHPNTIRFYEEMGLRKRSASPLILLRKAVHWTKILYLAAETRLPGYYASLWMYCVIGNETLIIKCEDRCSELLSLGGILEDFRKSGFSSMGITITTIYIAKGLEFDEIVILFKL